jgi:hypothetical protein
VAATIPDGPIDTRASITISVKITPILFPFVVEVNMGASPYFRLAEPVDCKTVALFGLFEPKTNDGGMIGLRTSFLPIHPSSQGF